MKCNIRVHDIGEAFVFLENFNSNWIGQLWYT